MHAFFSSPYQVKQRHRRGQNEHFFMVKVSFLVVWTFNWQVPVDPTPSDGEVSCPPSSVSISPELWLQACTTAPGVRIPPKLPAVRQVLYLPPELHHQPPSEFRDSDKDTTLQKQPRWGHLSFLVVTAATVGGYLLIEWHYAVYIPYFICDAVSWSFIFNSSFSCCSHFSLASYQPVHRHPFCTCRARC